MTQIKLFAISAFLVFLSCKQKEVQRVCGTKVQKEFNDNNISSSIESGCFIKYEALNEYYVDGNADLKVNGDTLATKSISFKKGKLLTKKGSFIIKQTDKSMKIRLYDGTGKIEHNGKEVELIKDNVLTIGG